MNHLHLELAHLRVADDRRFARTWRRRTRRGEAVPALPRIAILPGRAEVPVRACA